MTKVFSLGRLEQVEDIWEKSISSVEKQILWYKKSLPDLPVLQDLCELFFFLRLGRKQKSCDKQTDLCEVVIHSLHPAIAQRLPQAVVAIIGDEWWWQLLLLSLLDWFRYVQIFVLMLRTQEKHERFEGPQKCLRLLSEPTCLVGKCWFQRYLFTYILQPLAKLLGFMQSEETLPGQTWSNQIKSHWYCPMMSYDVVWCHVCCHSTRLLCQEDAPKTQIHVSTHPSVQDSDIKKLEMVEWSVYLMAYFYILLPRSWNISFDPQTQTSNFSDTIKVKSVYMMYRNQGRDQDCFKATWMLALLQAVSGRYYSSLSPPLVKCGKQASWERDMVLFRQDSLTLFDYVWLHSDAVSSMFGCFLLSLCFS